MSVEKRKAIQRAITLAQQGQYDKAIAEYQAILSVDPAASSLYNTMGDLYVQVGSLPEAIACYQKLVDALRSEGLHYRAIAVYKKIIKLDPNNLSALVACADLYAQEGLRAEAKDQYLLAAERSLKLGLDMQGLDVCERLIRLEPDDTGVVAKLASLLAREGRRLEAADLLGRLAQEVRAKGRLDDARLLYKQMVEIAPQRFTGWYCLGRIEFEAGHLQEAEEALRQAAKIDSTSPLPHLFLGQLYEQQMQPHLAKVAWQALLDRDPKHQEAHHRLGLLYLHEGDTEAAVREFDAAACSLGEAGELERAIALLGELGCAGEHTLIQERLGELYDRSGHPTEAKAAFHRAAQLHLAAGNLEERRRLLERLLALDPCDPDVMAERSTSPAHESGVVVLEPTEYGAPAASLLESGWGVSEALRLLKRPGELSEEIIQIPEETEHGELTGLNRSATFGELLAELEPHAESGKEGTSVQQSQAQGEKGFINLMADLEAGLLSGKSAPEPLPSTVEQIQKGRDLPRLADGSPESCAARYQLGMAYREMGLLDDAIAEFRRAAVDEGLALRACNMVGVCLLAKGDAEAAIHELSRGLTLVGRPTEAYHAIKYDLATAYESTGDLRTAVAILRDLERDNPSFCDTASRVRELEQRLGEERSLSAPKEENIE